MEEKPFGIDVSNRQANTDLPEGSAGKRVETRRVPREGKLVGFPSCLIHQSVIPRFSGKNQKEIALFRFAYVNIHCGTSPLGVHL